MEALYAALDDDDLAPKARGPRPFRAAALALAFGAGAIALVTGPFVWKSSRNAAAAGPDLASVSHAAPGDEPDLAMIDGGADAPLDAGPPPHTFRVADLTTDSRVEILTGTVGKRTFLGALQSLGISGKEAQRVFRALEPAVAAKALDHVKARDKVIVARDRGDGHVVAMELEDTIADVWQAREDDEGKLGAKKLDIVVDRRSVSGALLVRSDVRSALEGSPFEAPLLDLLDDALDGHADLSDLKPGVRLRIVATEERIEGSLVDYASIDAVEYVPVGHPSLRIYFWERGSTKDPKDGTEHKGGFYDEKGRQPYHGGWRSPIPMARISSRFNPFRMHPVLHVVMPHNGVDFAAPSGTPVYAAASGIVKSAGDGGPCGNMVQINHPNGLTSAYCHLSRIAPGLYAGEHVETRQLVGYVGQTGRATGPHLHFAVKRGTVFLDPLGMKLDGVRVIPPKDRDAFEERSQDLDDDLDAIALPAPDDSDAGPDANEANEANETNEANYDDNH
ncbi:hypothetical protein BH09MYX1_BH09MYX1_47530 [soil metagenome]